MDSDALPLSRSAVDRDAYRRRDGIQAIMASGRVRVLRVANGQLAGGATGLEFADGAGADTELAYLGTDDQGWRYVAELNTPADLVGEGLSVRDAGWQLDATAAGLATTALALSNWHGTHRFCPRCGAATVVAMAGWERHCTRDGSPHFPRTDPAVIMAITDDADRLLLGHAMGWPDRHFSVPAGFVEPGESLEGAVRREVAEETAIQVGEVRYGGSQPWPFPASLMLGFFGRALNDQPRPDGVEMAEAMFVSRADLEQLLADDQIRLPPPTSIAHYLIKEWFGRSWRTTTWRPPPAPS
ncbi:MAG: NAD(+) diphosphatase [Beutenbergiaceae bacterium]